MVSVDPCGKGSANELKLTGKTRIAHNVPSWDHRKKKNIYIYIYVYIYICTNIILTLRDSNLETCLTSWLCQTKDKPWDIYVVGKLNP